MSIFEAMTEEQIRERFEAFERGEDLVLRDADPGDVPEILAFRLLHPDSVFSTLYSPSAERRMKANVLKNYNRATICDNPFQTIGSNLCFRG